MTDRPDNTRVVVPLHLLTKTTELGVKALDANVTHLNRLLELVPPEARSTVQDLILLARTQHQVYGQLSGLLLSQMEKLEPRRADA